MANASVPNAGTPCHWRLSRVLRVGGKLKQHLLMSYARAMVAICDAQFTAKCLKG